MSDNRDRSYFKRMLTNIGTLRAQSFDAFRFIFSLQTVSKLEPSNF